MKESKFNVFYEAKSNSQKILAYNSRSNMKIHEKNYRIAKGQGIKKGRDL